MTDTAARLRAALRDPAAVYRSPEEVESDPTLGRVEKLAILRSWEEDARELAVAEEENMGGGEPSRLAEVVAARLRVAGEAEAGGAAHKQGGVAADPASLGVRHFARPVREIIHADQEIDEAALRLSLQERPILPVSDGDEIVGALGYVDLERAREAGGGAPLTARHVMRTELVFCYRDDAVGIARALMDRHACDHLLVVDQERTLIGILAREDLPPDGPGEAERLGERPEVIEPREEGAQAVASTIQPGGLDVYAERPKIRSPSRR